MGEGIPPKTCDEIVHRPGPDGRYWYEFVGHAQHPFHAAFVPGGSRVLTASRDGTIKAWGLQGEGRATLKVHSSPPAPLDLSGHEVD